MGVPHTYQRHGIVMDVQWEEGEGDSDVELTILDFSQIGKGSTTPSSFSTTSSSSTSGYPRDMARETPNLECILTVDIHTDDWNKVEYNASMWKNGTSRMGKWTTMSSDPVELVLARSAFLLRNPEILPDYDVMNANCECVAFWCKAGKWCTLQGSSLLCSVVAKEFEDWSRGSWSGSCCPSCGRSSRLQACGDG